MALQCLHKDMTIRLLEEMDFAPAAQMIAGQANAAVDRKQGNTAEEANLHAMAGYATSPDITGRPMGRLQTEEQTRERVEELLGTARREIVVNVLAGNQEAALRCLGEALHTVQDRAFHQFEPWPYRGIVEAFLPDPSYMFCHALRDLGLFDRLEIRDDGFDIGIQARGGRQWSLGARFFYNTADRFDLPLGRDGGEPEPFLGAGWMFTFTFGATPGSLPSHARFEEPPSRSGRQGRYWQLTTQGPTAMARAEDASRDFIEQIRWQVLQAPNGRRLWDNFRRFSGQSQPAVSAQRIAA